MGARQFRLTLKSGPDHITSYKEDAGQSFKRGELIGETDDTEVGALTGSSVEIAILGVAAADGQDTATPPNKAEVYVITPEQVWELHAASGKAPASYKIGGNYKIKMLQTASASYTISRENDAASTQISIRGPLLGPTGTEASSNQGAVVIGYSSDATKSKKGQKLLVRFAGKATVNST